ncbi:MAG TPA: hypothetical protein VFV49_10175 [Thermoanaerobaculia bacterium]|nr:hypothetical protein [Thermoanaerobaculia bacterium]
MSGLTRVLAAIALLCCGAYALPAGEAYVALVPWQVVEPHATVDAPLALFWIPASTEELRRSELLTSDDLTLFSSQCVAMRVVRLTDEARLAALASGTEPPLAVLADRSGHVIGRVEAERETLSVTEVEDLVRDELDRRAEQSDAMLDRARERADADDVAGAAALYRAVWEERCVCPRQARAAKKALRKMGLK